MEQLKIRQLTAEDATRYKALRLEALRNHPEAFGSDYEAEKDRPIERYATRLESEQSMTFGAFHENELVGVVTIVNLETSSQFICDVRHATRPKTANRTAPRTRGITYIKAASCD